MKNPNRKELKAVIKETIFEMLPEVGNHSSQKSQPPKNRTEHNLRERTTTSPVVPPKDQEVKQEWIRPSDGPRYCGLSRRTLFNLIEDGKIKSVCVRLRGQVRGIRLINCDSLDSFIKSQMEES